VLAQTSPGNISVLGEVPVQADGSFLAEVPAEVPIGFESLDENGRVTAARSADDLGAAG